MIFDLDNNNFKPIQQLPEIVLALIWQDAVELAIARDLASSCNISLDGVGFSDPKFDLRYDIAQERWDKWQDWQGRNTSIVAAIEYFLGLIF